MMTAGRQSLQLKVVSLILLLMLLVLAAVIPLSISRQKADLLEAATSTLRVNTDMLNLVIRNLMLSGEAPLAVETMGSLRQIGEFKTLELYRQDGSRAFQDFHTLDFVNSFQDRIRFDPSPRVDEAIVSNPAFRSVLDSGRPVIRELSGEREMEYFFPLRNERSCWDCHGPVELSGSLRGIAHFKISIAGIYRQINQAGLLLALFLAGAVGLFAVLLILAVRRIVLQPLLSIGRTVDQFGGGRMDVQVDIKSRDELGYLADRINEMFVGVQERLRLSKYVSRSTDAMIRQRQEATGRTNQLVVLFSDVRGFTRFADQSEAGLVVERLNHILDAQAQAVERYGGDIDKFMGDAVMALFTDPLHALKAAFSMVRKTYRLSQAWDQPLYIGIGLAYGPVIAGNIGSASRLEYAVIGDTVNLASRLCGRAAPNSILVSESLYTEVADQVEAVAVRNQTIKGKAEPVTYYAVKRIHAS